MKLLCVVGTLAVVTAQFFGGPYGAYPVMSAPVATVANTVSSAAPAASWATSPYSYGYGLPAYNYGGFGYPYNYNFARPVPQTCAQRATSIWQDWSKMAANYDGRRLSWMMIPTPNTVTNKAEMQTAIDNWNALATWKTRVYDVWTVGNSVVFKVNWLGSVSNVNGKAANPDTISAHFFDCNTNTETVYTDYGGVMSLFMSN